MAYRYEKESEDIVIDGFENGIQPSPHKGIANIQNANLSTETGEVVSSYARVQQSMTETATTGSLSYLSTDHVNLSIAGSNNLFKGNWITVTNSSNTGQLPNGTYYVPPSTGAGFELANYYNAANFIPAVSASLLVVAGGGGGGGSNTTNAGAGGGAGGMKTASGVAIQTATSYAITVGGGGAGGVGAASGTVGSDSSALGTTAHGGGAGAKGGAGSTAGGAGGSGGGSSNTAAAGTGTTGEGKNGGVGASGGGSGGGGGASAVGGNGVTVIGGDGGAGTASSISGASVTYAGGGGGGTNSGLGGGAGGVGGGGNGGNTNNNGVSGTVNTGGGGGGSGGTGTSDNGGAGGSGIVIISIPTSAGVTATGGTHTTSGGNDIWTFTSNGTWSPTIPPTTVASILTGFTAGLTATIQLAAVMGKPIASATETYSRSGTTYHRYYILDSQGLVWVYDDQNEVTYSSSDNVGWFLPDITTQANATGIAVISGFLILASRNGLFGKSVALLGNTNSQSTTWVAFPDLNFWQGSALNSPHFCYVGHQGNMYVTDGSYILNIFPASTLVGATGDNVQSFSSWTAPIDTTTGVPSVISGTSFITSDGKRVPVVFFTNAAGVLPYAISANTVYYLQNNSNSFNVYSAASGGSSIDIQTGAFGTQYFNTFYPVTSASSSTGGTPTYVLTPQRLTLPGFEVAQCMAEVGNTIIIGCQSNVLYPWNQQDNLPNGIISLPESNTQQIITVNQMAYVFPGNKGNVYVTDGSVASAVTTVPDYCAGVPGTPSSYIEPYFVWGGAMYLRGRVYFSILDQTSTKTGNCGGIWSFIPTQNLYIGQDIGIGLRIENQSSYGTYSGYSPILIGKVTQNAKSPQYWNAWQSDITTPIYGIDNTGTGASTTATTIVETDAIPTGTKLEKRSFQQIEVKFSTPLLTGDTVSMNYRKDLTSAWSACPTIQLGNNNISGLFTATFEKTQWLQLQAVLKSGTATSFIRLKEVRVR